MCGSVFTILSGGRKLFLPWRQNPAFFFLTQLSVVDAWTRLFLICEMQIEFESLMALAGLLLVED